MTGERQLNHSESEGVCVNCLSSFNKLQTRFPKDPGVGGLFVVQGEIRYKKQFLSLPFTLHTPDRLVAVACQPIKSYKKKKQREETTNQNGH